MAQNEIVFKVAEDVFVVEYAARDEMHPSRTVNDIYVMDFRDGGDIEENVGHNHYAHGITLTAEWAQAKFRAYQDRKDGVRA